MTLTNSTYICENIGTQGVTNRIQRTVWVHLSAPLDCLSQIPGGSCIIQDASGNLAHSAAAAVDDDSLPVTLFTLIYQWLQHMPEIDLMRAAAQSMQSNQHRLCVVTANVRKLIPSEIGRAGREARIFCWCLLVGHKIYGERASKSRIIRLEDLTLIHDRRSSGLDSCPGSMEMAIEEQGIQFAGRCRCFADIR